MFQLATQRSEHRKYFLIFLSNIRFVARQGQALCGDGDESDFIYIGATRTWIATYCTTNMKHHGDEKIIVTHTH